MARTAKSTGFMANCTAIWGMDADNITWGKWVTSTAFTLAPVQASSTPASQSWNGRTEWGLEQTGTLANGTVTVIGAGHAIPAVGTLVLRVGTTTGALGVRKLAEFFGGSWNIIGNGSGKLRFDYSSATADTSTSVNIGDSFIYACSWSNAVTTDRSVWYGLAGGTVTKEKTDSQCPPQGGALSSYNISALFGDGSNSVPVPGLPMGAALSGCPT